MHPHTLSQYLWAICSQNEAMCQAEVRGSIKPLYLISSGTIVLLWVLYTKPPLSLPSAMPDHITVGWTMVCEQSTIAYTPLAPYRITVCPSWTEERSQSPVNMEHMPLLHQRALPRQVSRQPTLLPWSLCGTLRMQHQGPPGPGEKVQKKWVTGPQWLLRRWWYPLCRLSTNCLRNTTSSSCTSPLNGMGCSHFAAATCSHQANAKGQSSAVILLHRPASGNPLGERLLLCTHPGSAVSMIYPRSCAAPVKTVAQTCVCVSRTPTHTTHTQCVCRKSEDVFISLPNLGTDTDIGNCSQLPCQSLLCSGATDHTPPQCTHVIE